MCPRWGTAQQEPGTEEISFSGGNRPLNTFSTKQVVWSEILYCNIWKEPLTVWLCTVCDLQEISKTVQNTDGKIGKQGRLTPVRLAHPISANWLRRSEMLSQSREESCSCIIFVDEQCQRFWLWVSPEPVSALWRSPGLCAIRSDDFHNRLLSRIQTQIRLWKNEELLLYFSVRARTHCQYFGQLPAAKLL